MVKLLYFSVDMPYQILYFHLVIFMLKWHDIWKSKFQYSFHLKTTPVQALQFSYIINQL